MALSITWIGAAGSSVSATASTSSTFSFTSLPTSGGAIIFLSNNHTHQAIVSAGSLATDGAYQSKSTLSYKGEFLFFPTVTTASQVLTLTKDAVYTELYAFVWGVTGHDTSDMFGAEASATSSQITISMEGSGNGLIVTYDPFAGTPSGGGTWGTEQNVTGYASLRSEASNSNTGGTITGWSAGTPLNIVEVKAAAGGSGGIPKTTKLTLLGVG